VENQILMFSFDLHKQAGRYTDKLLFR